MDPTQLVDEALRRFTVMQAAANSAPATALEEPATPALVAVFQHLAKLDGWAKIAIDRLVADPENARAAADLKLSMDQAARLHPQFMRTLAEVCATSAAAPPVRAPQVPAPGQL
ncbi:hypothetical protein LWF15_26535 [Kineosporia rhizophila]|uniref:hypothetical protein n=1 Tax=Kineosporia TaxID=49184 RepID=UPI000B1BAB9C|nr:MULTISPECIES: hypothetical protein [Kineosporia]MCE0539062.1 hypothetical protein [Kineosporia rhizophila]GLY17835.1 hypothetical protein Kisp01_48490 [Kineosporia sp. NBRC 101677]